MGRRYNDRKPRVHLLIDKYLLPSYASLFFDFFTARDISFHPFLIIKSHAFGQHQQQTGITKPLTKSIDFIDRKGKEGNRYPRSYLSLDYSLLISQRKGKGKTLC